MAKGGTFWTGLELGIFFASFLCLIVGLFEFLRRESIEVRSGPNRATVNALFFGLAATLLFGLGLASLFSSVATTSENEYEVTWAASEVIGLSAGSSSEASSFPATPACASCSSTPMPPHLAMFPSWITLRKPTY